MTGRAPGVVALAALALGAVACNALFGETAQCSTDADCASFGADYVCGPTKTCLDRGGDAGPSTTSPPATADAGAEAAVVAGGPLDRIAVTPGTSSVEIGGTQSFIAIGWDATNRAASPSPVFDWSVSGGGTIGSTGLFTATTAGGPFTVTVKSGSISSTATVTVTSTPFKIGETNILTVDDSGNADTLLAQLVTLPKAATITSLSFYIATAAGNLRLGLYDATGPNGGPGAKKAETAEFAAQAGWTANNVMQPVALPAGNYWLAYAPSDNNLHFERAGDGSGKVAYFSTPYGPLPDTFSTTPTTDNEHWSFYATFAP